jgi:hypothetical protein
LKRLIYCNNVYFLVAGAHNRRYLHLDFTSM